MKLKDIKQPNSSQFLSDPKQIKAWLDNMLIQNYKINKDLTVDVNGSVVVYNKKLISIPVKFGKVSGNFNCWNNNITSLQGAPSSVGGKFSCAYNNLTSLQGAPSSVGGHFNCSGNKLTSLQGAPSHVGGDFDCRNNNLTSLHNIHRMIKHIGGGIVCDTTVTHLMGLILIDGLQGVDTNNKKINAIINKHLEGDRDPHKCQEELIQAGFAEWAKI